MADYVEMGGLVWRMENAEGRGYWCEGNPADNLEETVDEETFQACFEHNARSMDSNLFPCTWAESWHREVKQIFGFGQWHRNEEQEIMYKQIRHACRSFELFCDWFPPRFWHTFEKIGCKIMLYEAGVIYHASRQSIFVSSTVMGAIEVSWDEARAELGAR